MYCFTCTTVLDEHTVKCKRILECQDNRSGKAFLIKEDHNFPEEGMFQSLKFGRLSRAAPSSMGDLLEVHQVKNLKMESLNLESLNLERLKFKVGSLILERNLI